MPLPIREKCSTNHPLGFRIPLAGGVLRGSLYVLHWLEDGGEYESNTHSQSDRRESPNHVELLNKVMPCEMLF